MTIIKKFVLNESFNSFFFFDKCFKYFSIFEIYTLISQNQRNLSHVLVKKIWLICLHLMLIQSFALYILGFNAIW